MQQQKDNSGGFEPFEVYPIETSLQILHQFATAREKQPVVYNEQRSLWEVFGYEEVMRVITDYNTFSSEALPGFSEDSFLRDTIVAKDPPDHRKMRNLVNVAFTPRMVNHLSGNIAQITQDLLDDALPRGEMDIASDIAFPLPAKVMAVMLGVPDKDWDIFRRWAGDRTVGESAPQMQGDMMRARQLVGQQMYDYFSGLLAERRRSPQDDLISALSVAEVDGERLSEGSLVQFCMLLLAAGQETTKNLIANAIYCFTEYPEACEHLIQHPELMPGAIEEVLRFLPAVWFTFRRAKHDVELAGQHIPAHSMLHTWNAAANRDAAQFSHPEQFDIQREPNRHMTFGHGIHFCLGAPLARLEAAIALPMMLKQLKNLRRVPGIPITVQAGIVYVIRELPVTFDTVP